MTRALQADLMDSGGSLDIEELLGSFEPESRLGGDAPFLDQPLGAASLQLELENRGSASSEAATSRAPGAPQQLHLLTVHDSQSSLTAEPSAAACPNGLQQPLASSSVAGGFPAALLYQQQLLQQQQFGLSIAGAPASPFLPMTVLQPPGFYDAAQLLQQQQALQLQPQQEQQEPRRRGRKPRDIAQMTEKQRRTREANQKFEEKQRARLREVEETLDSVTAQVERERALNDSAKLSSSMLEGMLKYKQALLGALEAAQQLNPPPGIVIPPSMVAVLQRERVLEAFDAEGLTKFAPDGRSDHLDDQGRVIKSPPFEAVARDWASIVEGLRQQLALARVRPGSPSSAQPSAGIDTSGAGSQPAQQQGQAGPCEQSQAACSPTAAAAKQPQQGPILGRQAAATAAGCETQGLGQQGACGFAGLQAAGDNAPPAESGSLWLGGSTSKPGACGAVAAAPGRQPPLMQQQPGTSSSPSGSCTVSQQGAPESGLAVGEQGPAAAASMASSGEGGRASDGGSVSAAALFVGVQANESDASSADDYVLSKTAGCKKLDWELLDRGLELQDGDELYRFSGPMLRDTCNLLNRVGVLCWQQALLFPDNANKLVALNLETCQPSSRSSEEDLPRWRRVLQQLRLRQGQLRELVDLHQEFMAMLRPALAQRATALQRLRELPPISVGCSQQDQLSHSLALGECNAALMRSMQCLNAAYATMSSGLFNLLDFPLQEAKLMVLSWPYYPQIHLLGVSAALELGQEVPRLDISFEPYSSQDASSREEDHHHHQRHHQQQQQQRQEEQQQQRQEEQQQQRQGQGQGGEDGWSSGGSRGMEGAGAAVGLVDVGALRL